MSGPANFNQLYPEQAVATCTLQQAEQLVQYDHHAVAVNGRLGVMLTYDWMPLEEHAGPFVLAVVFQHAEQHPRAPAEVQSILDELEFRTRR